MNLIYWIQNASEPMGKSFKNDKIEHTYISNFCYTIHGRIASDELIGEAVVEHRKQCLVFRTNQHFYDGFQKG